MSQTDEHQSMGLFLLAVMALVIIGIVIHAAKSAHVLEVLTR